MPLNIYNKTVNEAVACDCNVTVYVKRNSNVIKCVEWESSIKNVTSNKFNNFVA